MVQMVQMEITVAEVVPLLVQEQTELTVLQVLEGLHLQEVVMEAMAEVVQVEMEVRAVYLVVPEGGVGLQVRKLVVLVPMVR
jgi:hypothetical protein